MINIKIISFPHARGAVLTPGKSNQTDTGPIHMRLPAACYKQAPKGHQQSSAQRPFIFRGHLRKYTH